MVKKLILVGSAVFEQKYAEKIMEIRLNRLDNRERTEVLALMENLNDPLIKDKEKDILMSHFGRLLFKADSYNPWPYRNEALDHQYNIFRDVWKEAENLRASGDLLKMGEKIQCPLVAIHGDYDPHPYQGVQRPLSRVVKDFRFILIKNCGHYPWFEREASDKFYDILKKELYQQNL